jgi:TonB-dependent SusC/RagA subfamily outer membrane receptor
MRNLCKETWRALIMLLLSISVSWNIFAQDRKVTGKVSDAENGSGMPGVTVLVKGTAQGSNTDGNGNFTVSVPSNATLVFSFVGYTTQEVAIGNRTSVNVSLAADTRALQEVVVTGYASQNKRDITGAVAVVDVKEMKKMPASNIADQLQGRVAGVQVSSSGDPGSAAFIRVRGIGSINQNEPLYVIDGVPVQNESNLNFLNPNDIESIQVLKDAASASIYGSRAANGVIVITTKKGKAGSSKINVDIFTGIQTPGHGYDMANPDELLKINQGLSTGAGVPFESPYYINRLVAMVNLYI